MAETEAKLKMYVSSRIGRALALNRPISGKGKRTVHQLIQFVKIDEEHGEYCTDDPKEQEWLEDPKNGYGKDYRLAEKKLPTFTSAEMFADAINALKKSPDGKLLRDSEVYKMMEAGLEANYNTKLDQEVQAKVTSIESEQIKNAIRYGVLQSKKVKTEEEKAEFEKLKEVYK